MIDNNKKSHEAYLVLRLRVLLSLLTAAIFFPVKCDIYSIGVILWELVTREEFFAQVQFMSQIEDMVRSFGQLGHSEL